MIKIEKEDFKKILALADGKEKMFSITTVQNKFERLT